METSARHRNQRNVHPLTSLTLMLAALLSVSAWCGRTRAETQRSEYLSDLSVAQSAGTAMLDYASSHGGRLPDSHNWEESIKPYWPDKHFTVSFRTHPGDRLAMNRMLSGVKLDRILPNPDKVVLLYETRSSTRDSSGLPADKQYHQCGPSAKGWLMITFASGWACSCVKGPELSFTPKSH